MGDPNEHRRNQELAPMEKSNNSKLSWIWCHGLNSFWNTISTSIVVCTLLLVLPPLVALSVLEFVLSAPFGFMFSVCPEINEIMSILLGEPRPKLPYYSVSEDLCSDDLGKEDDNYNEEKVKEEGYEQDYDLKEEEKELEDDTRRAVEARMEDHSNCQTSGQLGIREASKDFEEVIVDKVEENDYEKVKEYRKESNDYNEEKVKEEGYEQDYDLKEEEKELEDDTRRGVEARMEDHSNCQTSGQLGIREASKDFEEVIVDKVEENDYEKVKEYRKESNDYNEEKVKEEGYEQDYDLKEEEKELEDDTRRAVEARMEDHSNCQTSGQLGIREASKDFEEVIVVEVEENDYDKVKEYRKESNDEAENDIDIEVVKEMDAFKLGTRTKDSSTTTVEYDNVERENLEKEKKREIRADEQDEDKTVAPSTRMTSPFFSWESSGSFGNLEELLAPPETETADGFQEDCDEVEEQQSPKIEPGELVKETMEMVEAVRNEGKVEIENIQQSMEEEMSILPSVSGSVNGAVLDLERVKLLAVEDSVDDVPRLQTINEQMESGKVKKKDDALASLQVEFEHTTNATMKVNTQKMEQLNPVGDIWNATYRSMGYEKKFEGIDAENHTFGMKGDKG